MTSPLSVRVTVLDTWEEFSLSVPGHTPVAEVKRQALQLARVTRPDQDARRLEILSNWGWPAVVSEYTRRLYYGNGIAPHVVGYVSAIQAEELAEYRRKGYRSDDRVGRKGLEQWGEEILMGKRGGTLYVFGPDGKPIGELSSVASDPGQEITTTLDRDFQSEVQKAMSVYNGAVVVLERDTGRVLAMASSPGFDSNAYEYENDNSTSLISQIVNDPRLPQFNRATQGQYPLGSVNKIPSPVPSPKIVFAGGHGA